MQLATSILVFGVLSAGAGPSPVRAAADPAQDQGSRQESPFAGLWKANLSKSKRDPNHQFQRATLRFEVDGDSVTLNHGGVNASGEEESGVTTLLADGKEHEVPEVPGMVVVTRWRGSRVLETVARKDGALAARGVYEVSADGRSLTASIVGTDAGGREFNHVVVFDRD